MEYMRSEKKKLMNTNGVCHFKLFFSFFVYFLVNFNNKQNMNITVLDHLTTNPKNFQLYSEFQWKKHMEWLLCCDRAWFADKNVFNAEARLVFSRNSWKKITFTCNFKIPLNTEKKLFFQSESLKWNNIKSTKLNTSTGCVKVQVHTALCRFLFYLITESI